MLRPWPRAERVGGRHLYLSFRWTWSTINLRHTKARCQPVTPRAARRCVGRCHRRAEPALSGGLRPCGSQARRRRLSRSRGRPDRGSARPRKQTSSRYSRSSMEKPRPRTLGARLGEVRQRDAGAGGVTLERSGAVEGLQFRESEVGEQRLAVRGAVQWHPFAGLPGDDDALVAGGVVIDEKDFAPVANGEMRGFSRAGGECLDCVAADC